MGLYIINREEKTTTKVLKVLLMVFVVMAAISGYFVYKEYKFQQVQRKVENPFSSLNYEVESIKKMYAPDSVKGLELSKEKLTFKIKEDQNLEPLISRYQDMIDVVFNKNGYNYITIYKKNIMDNKTK